MKCSIQAAASAAAFAIIHDTVGSGPTFTKGQTVPREDLAWLGIERLLEAGAIEPAEPLPEEPEPVAEVFDLAAVTLPELAVELAGRGYAIVAAEELEAVKAEIEPLKNDVLAKVEECRRLEAELEASREAHAEARREAGAMLAAKEGTIRVAEVRIRELEAELAKLREAKPAETADSEPGPTNSDPAAKPAKKGK